MRNLVLILLLTTGCASAQSYAPLPGEAGSTAIHKDSSIILTWATGVAVQRGPLDIAQPGNGNANFGTDTDAIGMANGNVVSFQCVDNGGVNCEVSIFTRKDKGNLKQLYVYYNDRVIAYNMKLLKDKK